MLGEGWLVYVWVGDDVGVVVVYGVVDFVG